jgi:hypothetical protein
MDPYSLGVTRRTSLRDKESSSGLLDMFMKVSGKIHKWMDQVSSSMLMEGSILVYSRGIITNK